MTTPNKLNAKQKEELIKRALDGENRTDLAKEFGIHGTTLSYHLRQARGAVRGHWRAVYK